MPLSGFDAAILGAVGKTNGAACSRLFRKNTSRLLQMLNINKIPKPPAFVIASKIINDLQLPSKSIKQFDEKCFYSSKP
jgi:hypothetical protein